MMVTAWEEVWNARIGWNDVERRLAAAMTQKDAIFVRWLRVDQHNTHRGVAKAYSRAWRTSWGSNQEVGVFLCEAAARCLDEDPDAAIWNSTRHLLV